MSTAVATAPLRYGATELKELIARNTKRAFYFTVSLLLLLFLFSFAYKLIKDIMFPPPNVVRVLLTKATLQSLAPPPVDNAPPPPPPPLAPPPPGPAARAGTPVAVPDALIAPDEKEFANIEDISAANSQGGGDGTGFAEVGDPNGGLQIEQREEELGIDDFIAVEVEIRFDNEDLKKRVVYPPIARSSGLEGSVTVGVYVTKTGKVDKVQIIQSDNAIFDAAAMKAVRETVYAPAIQNGTPVGSWMRIPVKFRLR
ncbi:MAG: energy transducer TonB [bacterium]|nr:energy transducer TonB [bacterium]